MGTKSRNRQQKTVPRKSLAATVGLVAASIAGFAGWHHYAHIPNFENAKARSSVRQEYIEEIVKRYSPPAPATMTYTGDRDIGTSAGLSAVMATQFELYPESCMPKNFRIYISDSAFELSGTESEFLSLLVDHEYRHMDQALGKVQMPNVPTVVINELRERVLVTSGDLCLTMQELLAFKYQIGQFTDRSASERFERNIMNAYNQHRTLVESKPKTALTEYVLREFPHRAYYVDLPPYAPIFELPGAKDRK